MNERISPSDLGGNDMRFIMRERSNMRQIAIILFMSLIYNVAFTQIEWTKTDTTKSVYTALSTRKIYRVNCSSTTTNGKSTYLLNGKKVRKRKFDKYCDYNENIGSCTPCILMTYDANDKLLYKGIQYTDCPVGFWIEYYPNGQAKLIGHYKENESDNWENAWDKGYCSKDGAFTYFNEKGEELYTEYWKDDQFIKQIPEQTKTELWNVALTLDSVKVDQQVLTPNQISQLTITPQFKNSFREGTNITIKFEITAAGRKPISQTFTLDNFNTIDVQKMLNQAGILASEKFFCSMFIFNNGSIVTSYWLNVKQ